MSFNKLYFCEECKYKNSNILLINKHLWIEHKIFIIEKNNKKIYYYFNNDIINKYKENIKNNKI